MVGMLFLGIAMTAGVVDIRRRNKYEKFSRESSIKTNHYTYSDWNGCRRLTSNGRKVRFDEKKRQYIDMYTGQVIRDLNKEDFDKLIKEGKEQYSNTYPYKTVVKLPRDIKGYINEKRQNEHSCSPNYQFYYDLETGKLLYVRTLIKPLPKRNPEFYADRMGLAIRYTDRERNRLYELKNEGKLNGEQDIEKRERDDVEFCNKQLTEYRFNNDFMHDSFEHDFCYKL